MFILSVFHLFLVLLTFLILDAKRNFVSMSFPHNPNEEISFHSTSVTQKVLHSQKLPDTVAMVSV